MALNSARRNLLSELEAASIAILSPNMAAGGSPIPFEEDGDSIADQDLQGQPSYAQVLCSKGGTTLTHSGPMPSGPPQDSSKGSTLSGLELSRGVPILPVSLSMQQPPLEFSPTAGDFGAMMSAFSEMLSKGLAQTAAQITASIHADLQQIGSRLDLMEQKSEQSNTRIIQNTSRIQDLQEHLESAMLKIDDLENRSRRANLRVRGIPESYKDSQETIKAIIKQILPGIPEHRLELDRAHRALQPPRQDGLPRDLIVKPLYFSVKEEVMRASRSVASLEFHGHKFQIFSDLSPLTIQRRRTLKPLLQVLQDKEITYRWGFPLRVHFSFRNQAYGFSSLAEGEKILRQLHLISMESHQSTDTRGPSSATKRPSPHSPVVPSWQKQKPKRSKDGRPP